jgi:dsDNA-specific endonuclease/ATPase MutS2
MEMPDDQTKSDPLPLPINGVLDLHQFRPRDVKPLVLNYIELCREKGICELRIIHGKGIGQLRNTVHALLSRHPEVERFSLATEALGGSGATIVVLGKH